MPPTRKRKPLSHGRPPSLTPRTHPSSISSRTTASIIRTHHRLNKQHAAALAANRPTDAARIQAEIDANGGLTAYQAASATGQSAARGGDSSKQLVEWLVSPQSSSSSSSSSSCTRRPQRTYALLEVGALAVDNACARSGLFNVTRIDLHARVRGVEQQDFMARPVPQAGKPGWFDVVSLSLVLNYVPDAPGRGEMLRRTTRFLRQKVIQADTEREEEGKEMPFPALFLVLPAPCVTNSRYLDEARLGEIMASLGYEMVHRKLSAKLVYYLWHLTRVVEDEQAFRKVEVNPGKGRNNFAVVLESSLHKR